MVDTSTHTPLIRVLLADDHVVVRGGIRLFLERAGDIQVVAEADDGEQAESLIAQHHPDVAVLDIQMPKASGIDVTRWARTHAPDMGVLVLTAYDDPPYVMAVLQAGAHGYVLKTAEPGELVCAVREVYAGKSVLDAALTQKMVAHLVSPHDEPPGEALSEREREILALAGKGHTNKAIGFELGISDRTVQAHMAHIFKKLHATSRAGAVMRAVGQGWIAPGAP